MKKISPYILILVILVGLFSPGLVSANALTSAVSTVTSYVASGLYDAFGATAVYVFLTPIAYVIFQLASLIMWIAGGLLDFVINNTILNMAKNLSGMDGINTGWKVLRDLMNIAFIFLLVYEGIKMIIGQSDITQVKKFITGIVLASLLINFSLFFTKVMIDASNVVTIGLYNSILSDAGSTKASGGLSNAYQQALGTQGFLDGPTIEKGDSFPDNNYNRLVVLLMASLLVIITSFIFFAISVLFIVRYIVLLLLLILSPIAYMGMALPGIAGKRASEWWDSLWGQLLFAPIFMLMTWVILTLITSPNFTGVAFDPNEWTNFARAGLKAPGVISLLFNFVVIIGLAIASLVISKKWSTQGSSMISDLSGKATTFAGNTLLGGTARFSRATLGRYGNKIINDENSEDLKRRAAKGEIGARIKLASANFATGSSFDIRATKKLGFQELAKTTSLDFGKADAKKENYKAIREEEAKKEGEKIKRYKSSEAEYEKAREDDKKVQDAAKYRLNNDVYDDNNPEDKARRREDEQAAKYNKNEMDLNRKYQERADKVANRVGHIDNTPSQVAQRYAANILGGPLNVLGIPGISLPKDRADRKALASKIRAAARGKGNKDKLIDAARALAAEGETGAAPAENPSTGTTPSTGGTSSTP